MQYYLDIKTNKKKCMENMLKIPLKTLKVV